MHHAFLLSRAVHPVPVLTDVSTHCSVRNVLFQTENNPFCFENYLKR